MDDRYSWTLTCQYCLNCPASSWTRSTESRWRARTRWQWCWGRRGGRWTRAGRSAWRRWDRRDTRRWWRCSNYQLWPPPRCCHSPHHPGSGEPYQGKNVIFRKYFLPFPYLFPGTSSSHSQFLSQSQLQQHQGHPHQHQHQQEREDEGAWTFSESFIVGFYSFLVQLYGVSNM